jgi:VanZ family protein
MAEYGLLWVLWWRAFDYQRPATAAAIAIAYAASDEFHQTFVEGRHGAPLDVAIDGVGILIAAVVATRLRASRAR